MMGLNMRGPYSLAPEEIDRSIRKGTVGNYALGFIDSMDGRFVILYIGRSDQDLNTDLKTFLGRGYKNFKYCCAINSQEAFVKECCDYHDFSPIHNKAHPQRPEGSTFRCPKCDIFGSH